MLSTAFRTLSILFFASVQLRFMLLTTPSEFSFCEIVFSAAAISGTVATSSRFAANTDSRRTK